MESKLLSVNAEAPLSRKENWRNVACIFGFSLVARLAALPWAQTYDGDAVTRTFTAGSWLAAPRFITHDIWPPLHNYLLAVALWLYPDYQIAPPLLTAVLSAGTAVALYLFTRLAFHPQAGIFVALAFSFSPLVFRQSLMAMSETPFMFFLAWSLYFLARVRYAAGGMRCAMLAGLFISAACGIRYEGWLLIPPLSVVLWRRPRHLLSFMAVASFLPIFWMISNAVTGPAHDPLYGIRNQQEWEAHLVSASGGMTTARRLLRLLFMPVVMLLGLSFVGLVAAWGIVRVLKERREQAIWLIPTSVLLAAYVYKAFTGSLAMDPRYTLIVSMLIAPFTAELFRLGRPPRLAALCALVLGTFLMPYTYAAGTQLLGRVSPEILQRVDRLSTSMDMQRVLEPIPRWTKEAPELIRLVQLQTPNAAARLVFVNLDWQVAQQVCLATGHGPDRRLLLPSGLGEAERGVQKREQLANFLRARSGKILLFTSQQAANSLKEFVETLAGRNAGLRFKVVPIGKIGGVEVWRLDEA